MTRLPKSTFPVPTAAIAAAVESEGDEEWDLSEGVEFEPEEDEL